MNAAPVARPRFARTRKVLGWVAFLPASFLATALVAGGLNAVFGEFPTQGIWVLVPIVTSLYVGQLICPAPRFALCMLALVALGATIDAMDEPTTLLGYVLGVSAAVALATGRDSSRRNAMIRALRWTLSIPAGLVAIGLLGEALGLDGDFDAVGPGFAALTLVFAASAMTASIVAPSRRLRMLLLFAAITCLIAIQIADGSSPFEKAVTEPWLGIPPPDLAVILMFATWALGTGVAALVVIRAETWAHGRALPASSTDKSHRYKGTAPYQDDDLDRKTFFGRDREARSLMSLVQAERLVVLFSKSGMGKSSLINAGLVQPLRERGHLPLVVRLIETEQSLPETVIEGVRGAAQAVDVDIAGGDATSLWRFFKTAEFWSRDNDLLRPVLILDQFEELFTLHEAADRQGLIKQLGELIRGPSGSDDESGAPLGRGPADVRVVLAMREDFLANIEELAREIPAILQNRFRLGPLSREAAREVIVEPARLESDVFQTGRFEYEPAAVDRIIQFLANQRMGEVSATNDEVEPVQLQLICRYLEESVRRRGDKAGIVIRAADLGGDAQMEEVLEGFYDRIVDSVRPVRKARAVRRLCETRLISRGGRRLAEDGEVIEETYHLPQPLLRQLVDARLLRAEARLGSTLYEISHDRLIEPIQRSRRKRAGQRLRTGLLAIPLAAAVVWAFAFTLSEHLQRAQELASLELELMHADAHIALNAARRLVDRHGYDAAKLIARMKEPSIVNPTVMLQWPIATLDADQQTVLITQIRDNYISLIGRSSDLDQSTDPGRATSDPRLAPAFLGAVLTIIDDAKRSGTPGFVQVNAADLRAKIAEHYGRVRVGAEGTRSRCNGGNRGSTPGDTPRSKPVSITEYRCFNPPHPVDVNGADPEAAAKVTRYEAIAYAAFVGAALPTQAMVEKMVKELEATSEPIAWRAMWYAEPEQTEQTGGGQSTIDRLRRSGTHQNLSEVRPFTIFWPTE